MFQCSEEHKRNYIYVILLSQMHFINSGSAFNILQPQLKLVLNAEKSKEEAYRHCGHSHSSGEGFTLSPVINNFVFDFNECLSFKQETETKG